MKSINRGFFLLVPLLISLLLVSCGGGEKMSPAGDTTDVEKKGGVFADVVAALSEDDSKPPDLDFKKGEMTKKEWKLFIQARNRLYVPIETYDYYYSEDEYGDESEGEKKVESLDDILKAEREQYLTLRRSLGDTAKPYDEVKESVDEKLKGFFDDLAELTEVTPTAKREKVLEIVCLRFSNTLLKQGVLPESYSAKSPDK